MVWIVDLITYIADVKSNLIYRNFLYKLLYLEDNLQIERNNCNKIKFKLLICLVISNIYISIYNIKSWNKIFYRLHYNMNKVKVIRDYLKYKMRSKKVIRRKKNYFGVTSLKYEKRQFRNK